MPAARLPVLRAALLPVLMALLGLVALPGTASAQELFCRVTIDKQQLNRQDVQFLDDFGRDLERYLNDRRWTDDTYDADERVECDVRVVFTQALTQTRFKASYGITTRRPIYGTSQKVTILQVLDPDWEFDYGAGTPLTFDLSRFDPILSVVNFYAYLALGYDYDTFSDLGGTALFEKARDVAQIASSSNAVGWTSFGTDRTRLRLITQLLDPRYVRLRKAYFALHYGAMDHFVENPDAARTVTVEALREVKALFDEVTKQYAVDLFLTTKGNELVSMLEQSSVAADAYGLLMAMDPARQSDYNRLIN